MSQQFDSLLVVPFVLGVAFVLWFLWNVSGELNHRYRKLRRQAAGVPAPDRKPPARSDSQRESGRWPDAPRLATDAASPRYTFGGEPLHRARLQGIPRER